ncbi:hypothetical protein ZIOFF_045828 [Zingiber officinale]|uniref:Transmembrane protein n=1 Tax=Zingiber officinale TaxID=94328 RepID=A0A8J5KYP9_ZINOF|nr:hypothetical protein ZIOFF_045828 [Zingiber officinale]
MDSQSNHVVDISSAVISGEESHKQANSGELALQYHPLNQIAESPGHLLLFKLWQREEDLHGRRAAALEARMDAAKRAVFHLSCLFLAFHGLSFTLLFNASVAGASCRSWWLPCSLSLTTSLAVTVTVQAAVRTYWRISQRLQRERQDGRALARCVRELRMKGADFDLSKEPQKSSKRMKSSSVEVKWRPLGWCSSTSSPFASFPSPESSSPPSDSYSAVDALSKKLIIDRVSSLLFNSKHYTLRQKTYCTDRD